MSDKKTERMRLIVCTVTVIWSCADTEKNEINGIYSMHRKLIILYRSFAGDPERNRSN